jgi:hypothetical protein
VTHDGLKDEDAFFECEDGGHVVKNGGCGGKTSVR